MSIGERIAFVAMTGANASAARQKLAALYGNHPPAEADVIVALGGDGFMLQTLHRYMALGVPIYGMNQGTVGFLMNNFAVEGLRERLRSAELARLHPLRMLARREAVADVEALAINEVSLLRQTRQAAKLRIRVDGRVRLDELSCDGVLLATPAGSTAYNLSAHGPILPLNAQVLALTPISAFRPRRWRGAILPRHAQVDIEVLEREKRPVSATADGYEVRDVLQVTIREAPDVTLNLLYDPEHSLEERILAEQFQP